MEEKQAGNEGRKGEKDKRFGNGGTRLLFIDQNRGQRMGTRPAGKPGTWV